MEKDNVRNQLVLNNIQAILENQIDDIEKSSKTFRRNL